MIRASCLTPSCLQGLFEAKGKVKKRVIISVLSLVLGLIISQGISAWASVPSGFQSEKSLDSSSASSSYLELSRDGQGGPLLGMGPVMTTQNPTNFGMGAGTYATLHGSLDDLNGFPQATVWFEWGYDTAYGNTIGTQTLTGTGAFSAALTDFDPDKTIHYRVGGRTDGINYGNDTRFGVEPTGLYRMMSVLPYIFLAGAIIFIMVGIYTGMPIMIVIIVSGILALMGTVGTTVILSALQAMW